MPLKVRLIVNCDDAALFWVPEAPIPNCIGFSIGREKKRPDGSIQRDVLHNRMGFSADKPKRGEHRPSTEWPFQRLWWTDHEVNLGDTVRYSVCPMVIDAGALSPVQTECSPWTPWKTLTCGQQDGYSAFFNRGLVISQFMARYLAKLKEDKALATTNEALKVFKASLGEHELPIRAFLSGALRDAMLGLLKDALNNGKQVFGALYELADDELIGALSALGGRAHVVLANGSITKEQTETLAQARKRDENSNARKRLNAAGVEVFDRFVSPEALGHNKFLVISNSAGKPETVWTGSTNWTSTGLCTQTNNGLLVSNDQFAAEFFAQWKRLRDAGSEYPAALVDSNSLVKKVATNTSSADIWFTRTKGGIDLAAIDAEIRSAKEGVLFLMFQPGGIGTLKTLRVLAKAKPSLYVRGVVSNLPSDMVDGNEQVAVDLQSNGSKQSMALKIVQPRGINAFANWAATVARSEFLKSEGGVIGNAIVHSKVVVIDPFTNPIVITGSHNFSGAASKANDENFVIVRGNKELAESYAAHIMGVYDHYRWLSLVGKREAAPTNKQLSGFLNESDTWLTKKLASAGDEMNFWAK
jgi:phosphatidylserine/phosphatidylglycerophosphate/cardiolipin synthase-like enzyme